MTTSIATFQAILKFCATKNLFKKLFTKFVKLAKAFSSTAWNVFYSSFGQHSKSSQYFASNFALCRKYAHHHHNYLISVYYLYTLITCFHSFLFFISFCLFLWFHSEKCHKTYIHNGKYICSLFSLFCLKMLVAVRIG